MSIFPWLSSQGANAKDQHLAAFLKEHTAAVPTARPDLEDTLMAQIMAMPLSEPNSEAKSVNSVNSPATYSDHFTPSYRKWWLTIPLALLCFSGAGALWLRPNAPQLTVAEEEVIEKTLVSVWSVNHNTEANDLGITSEESQLINHDELDLEAEIDLMYQSNEVSELSEP